jgi:hypothetical protein
MLAEREAALCHSVLPGRAPSLTPSSSPTNGTAASPISLPSTAAATVTDHKRQSPDTNGHITININHMSSTNTNASGNDSSIGHGHGNSSNANPSSSMVWRPTDWEARQRRGLLASQANGDGSNSGSDSGSDAGSPTNDSTHNNNNNNNTGNSNGVHSHGHSSHHIVTMHNNDNVALPLVSSSSSSQMDGDPIDRRWLSFNPKGTFNQFIFLPLHLLYQ